MGLETPAPALTGYIQRLDGQWGYAEPFELRQGIESTEPMAPPSEKSPIQALSDPPLTTEQRELKAFLSANADESFSLRELSGKGFAKRLNLRSIERLEAVAAALVAADVVVCDADGLYSIVTTA
jgi:hypothetical protein